MLIEFFGLSGSGKTTLANRMIDLSSSERIVSRSDYLADNKARPHKYLIRVLRVLKFIAFHPFLSVCALRIVVLSKQKFFIHYFKLLFNLLSVLTFASYSNSRDTFVADQGFFQAIWSIALLSNVKVDYDLVLSLFVRAYGDGFKLVFIHADVEDVVYRLAMRSCKNSRFSNSTFYNENFFITAVSLMNEIHEFSSNIVVSRNSFILNNKMDDF